MCEINYNILIINIVISGITDEIIPEKVALTQQLKTEDKWSACDEISGLHEPSQIISKSTSEDI